MSKSKSKINNNNNNNNNGELPFVSVCTPTFNRRPFIEMMIKCFDSQDYPKDKMEWVIVDDGSDPIEDMVKSHPNVKYYKYYQK
jgi:glycosyltransferase involved in cell wall biosynthesis